MQFSNIIIFHLSCLPKQMFIANVPVLCVNQNYMSIFILLNI